MIFKVDWQVKTRIATRRLPSDRQSTGRRRFFAHTRSGSPSGSLRKYGSRRKDATRGTQGGIHSDPFDETQATLRVGPGTAPHPRGSRCTAVSLIRRRPTPAGGLRRT
jgi:hypothetical protein